MRPQQDFLDGGLVEVAVERDVGCDLQFIGAAAQVVADQGVAAATFEAIGRKAGYSRGLATQRFGSKQGLIEALVDSLHQGFEDGLAAEHPPEKELDYLASYKGAEGKMVEWKRVDSDASHSLSFSGLKPRENVVAYASVKVTAKYSHSASASSASISTASSSAKRRHGSRHNRVDPHAKNRLIRVLEFDHALF